MQPVTGDMLWRGEELWSRKGVRQRLTQTQIDTLRAVAIHIADLDRNTLTVDDLPLPGFETTLADIRHALSQGPGVVRLQNFPVDLPLKTLERLFYGFATHLGTPLSQSAKGETLFHVSDAGFGNQHAKSRGPNTRKSLSFHTDRCDVIGFCCVRQAREGGENYVVSSAAVHNEILATRPDLLEVLYQPYAYQRHNIDTGNSEPYCQMPIFGVEQGHFSGYIMRVLIQRAYASGDLPPMTPAQQEALDLVETTARRPDLHTTFRQEPGDVILVNNLTNFHARTEFRDHDDPALKRLLLRIWLCTPDSRPLPPSFEAIFGATKAGAIRGGIHPPA